MRKYIPFPAPRATQCRVPEAWLSLAKCDQTDTLQRVHMCLLLSSKRLQFVTSGLMSGTYAFTKLFICATLRIDPTAPDYEPSHFECPTFAKRNDRCPGRHRFPGYNSKIFDPCMYKSLGFTHKIHYTLCV